MGYTASKVIKIAQAEVGYLEKKTNNDLDHKAANAGSGNFTKYARDLFEAGYYNGNKNGYAWCDIWHDWVHYIAADKDAKLAQEITYQSGPYGAGCGYSAEYYKRAGRFYKVGPKVGDQIFFWNSKKTSVAHTGIVIKVSTSTVYTIEGNTSISRNHCNIFVNDNGSLVIHDFNSYNGTFVNNNKITSDTILYEGDTFYLADEEFRVL